MDKIKLIALVMTGMLLLTGCGMSEAAGNTGGSENKKTATVNNSEQGTLPQKGDKQEQSTGEQTGDKTGTGTEPGAGTKPDQTQPVEQKPDKPGLPKLDKLDTAALDKLDNTKYSWWIKLNSEHKTPGTPDNIRKLIAEYDGIFIGNTDEKVIYLTFDEGYENGYTPKILDTLKENDVRALFFVTGPYIRKNADLVKRMLDEGHQVGNHTINHPSLPSVDYAKLEKELYGLETEFMEKFGTGFRYMRPPMGEYSERTLAAAQQLGYKTVFWSFAYRDFEVDKQKGADYAYAKVMGNLHNGAVLLLHAVSSDNAEALDGIIKDIKAKGYEIRPFDL